MKAVKGNKEYFIDENQKKAYQTGGYDIKEDDGTLIAYGRGKTVAFDEHMNAVKEIERLQKLVSEQNAENEAMKAELAALREKQEPAETAGAKKAGK